MTTVVFWVLFSVGVGILANNKGRSGAGWFFVSVLFSPLLGLVFCLVSKDLSNDAKQPIDGATHRKCPKCAEYILPDATACKHCGAGVEPDRDFYQRKGREQMLLAEKKRSDAVLGWSIIAGIAGLIYLRYAVF